MTTTSTSVTPAAGVRERLAPQVTCLLVLVALIDSQLVASIAPQIAAGVAASETAVAAGVTVYSIAAAVVALGLAWFSHVHEPRRWLPATGFMFAAASLVTAVAPNIGVYYAGRALAGFVGGLISALAIAALANASSYDKRGSQMSWVAISYFLAPVVGVPLGTILTGAVGWRVVFLLSAALAVGAGVLARAFPLPDMRLEHEEPVDSRRRGFLRAVARLWSLGNETASARMGIVSAFFVSGGLVGFTAFLGIWLANAFHAGTSRVSAVYLVAGLGAVAGGAFGGKLADRLGKRRVALTACTAMWLVIPVVASLAWSVALFVFVAAAAFVASLRVAPLQALITELVSARDRATFVALRNASSQLGIAAAVAAAGPIYGRYGMMGVALASSALTILAWLTIRFIREPGEQRTAPRRHWSLRAATAAARGLVLLVVFLLVSLPFFLSFLVTKATTRPDERNLPETPSTYGVPYEDVTFESSDKNTLSGWYVPSTGRQTTVVMSHGLFRSRYELLKRGCDLARLGYGVLLYDLRRHGKSEAEFSTIGYQERHDVEGAVAFVRSRAPADRVVLFGVSMGAAATLLAASELDGVSAVVADSSFMSLSHTVSHHLGLARIPRIPFAPMLVWMTASRMAFLPQSFDVEAAVRKIRAPILFIGGTADVRMPIDTVLDPLYRASANPRSSRFVVEGAGHGHAYDTDPTGYIQTVNVFLQDADANRPPG